jgi:uncharacterized coiled-coil DUF342 family protein
MGKNKKVRKRLKGLEEQIELHEAKVAQESSRFIPDQGRIRHWQTELRAWRAQAARLQRRLPGRK